MTMRVDHLMEAMRHEPEDLRTELLEMQASLHREIRVLGLRMDNLNVILRAVTESCMRERAEQEQHACLHTALRKMGKTDDPGPLLIEHIITLPELPSDSSAY